MYLIKAFFESDGGRAFLFEDTFLCDVFGVSAFERDLDLKTPHDFTVIVGGLGDMAVAENFGEVLLGGAGYPHFAVASLVQVADYLLQLKQKCAPVVNEL